MPKAKKSMKQPAAGKPAPVSYKTKMKLKKAARLPAKKK